MAKRWLRAVWACDLALLAAVSSLAAPAVADEGGGGHYQPGYAGFTFGMLPTERGFYFSNFQRQYIGGRRGDQPLEIGGRVQFGVVTYAFLELPSCLYMTGRTLLGGRLGMALAMPVSYVDANKVNAAGPVVSPQQQRNFNLGDAYVAPVVLGWDCGNFHYAAYLGVFAPTGEWHVGELAPTGKNFWTFEPGLGFTYLDPKSGCEASSYVGVDFNSANQTIDYRSGDDFHIDIVLAKHVLRTVLAPQARAEGLSSQSAGSSPVPVRWEGPDEPQKGGAGPASAPPARKPQSIDVAAGIAFSCYEQLTGDSGANAALGPFKGQQFGLGPALRCVATFGQTPVTLQLRLLKEFAVQNRPEGVSAWLVGSLRL